MLLSETHLQISKATGHPVAQPEEKFNFLNNNGVVLRPLLEVQVRSF